jgi:hypothetical protein
MLRDKDENLRVEEIDVPPHLVGSQIADFDWVAIRQNFVVGAANGRSLDLQSAS